jgi:hypothetical protein
LNIFYFLVQVALNAFWCTALTSIFAPTPGSFLIEFPVELCGLLNEYPGGHNTHNRSPVLFRLAFAYREKFCASRAVLLPLSITLPVKDWLVAEIAT